MSNAFNKEEKVAFEQVVEGFNDALVLSKNVSKYSTDQSMMERTNNVIWRPQPYIAQSYSGTDATSNFNEATQLAVPATIGYSKHSTAILSATELRDMLQEGRLGQAAAQKLASDINVAIGDVAALQGTLVVQRTAAATGFDDVAEIEAVMNEQGVQMYDRYLALSTRDYNGMAGNLASRTLDNSKSLTAYDRAFIGRVASFDAFKLDTARRITAAAGGAGLTIDTRDAAVNYYIPEATSTATTGETSNVDNRYQLVTISDTTNVAAGDAFTIAGVNSVHHITKQDTGKLKTFRVISVASDTTMVISPPLITNQVASNASEQYQNCVVNTKAANSAIVFLNKNTAYANPFWQKDALEILPGRYAVPTDAGAGVLRATTENGIEIVMQKQYDINTMKTKYRWDTLFGVVNKQPEMSGIVLFGQA
jgi:hypothetical protein